MILLRIAAFALAGCCLTGLAAQDAMPATGGDGQGSGGSVRFTIGQVWYHPIAGTEGIVLQGVQHPFEIQELPGVNVPEAVSLHCTLYPNPVTDQLVLKTEDPSQVTLTYAIYDSRGIKLKEDNIRGAETHIFLGELGAATYILRVSDSQDVVKSFKIIKK